MSGNYKKGNGILGRESIFQFLYTVSKNEIIGYLWEKLRILDFEREEEGVVGWVVFASFFVNFCGQGEVRIVFFVYNLIICVLFLVVKNRE